ncbi:MAG: YfhO family protein [Candidatus Binatia bacterium]|nr:YfhO family protein [Candidatus Binatia bacterium]
MIARARRIAPAAGALLVYAIAVPWAFRPWFLGPDLVPHTEGPIGSLVDADLNLNIWILAWVAHAVFFDPAQLLDGNIFHPALNTIAGSENMLAHVPFTGPVLAFTGNAVTMLKAYVLESVALSGLGMFMYVRHHTKDNWAALVAGAAFTFTQFRVETVPQPQYLGMAFLPLALLAIDLNLEDGRRRWLAAFASALVLQALCCVYIGFFAFILCPVYILARTIPASVSVTAWIAPTARLAAAMIAAAIALIPAALPYLRGRSDGMIPEHDLLFIQNAAWAPWRYISTEFVWWTGIVAVLLVSLDLARRVWNRGARNEPLGPARAQNPRTALWILIAVTAVLAAGPYLPLPGGGLLPLPYIALYEILPGFSSIRVPVRFLLVIATALSALAGLAFAMFSRNQPTSRTAGAAAALTVLAVVGAAPSPHSAMSAHLDDSTSDVYRWLAEEPEPGAVLEIPGQSTEQDVVGNLRNSRYMVASSIHWRPLLNGYTAYPPPSAGFYSAAIRELPAPAALALLVETSDLRWVILHRNELTPLEAARWPTEAPDGLQLVARFDSDELYAVTRERVTDWRQEVRARMAGEISSSLGGTSLEALPEECRSGRILTVDTPERIPPFPLARHIPVRIANDSDCVWPALGLLENGLVGLDYRWIPKTGAPAVAQVPVPMFRLLSDVPAGGEVDGALMLTPPKGPPGDWTLEVRLVQKGVNVPIATARERIHVRTPRGR